MNNSAAHTELKNLALIAHGSRPGVRLFNNPVGDGWMGRRIEQTSTTLTLLHPRHVKFGLCQGSSDTVGWKSVTITEAMVGTTLAQFVAPEFKTGKGRPNDDQVNFLRAVIAAGGLAGVVRSPDDLGTLLDGRNLFGVAA